MLFKVVLYRVVVLLLLLYDRKRDASNVYALNDMICYDCVCLMHELFDGDVYVWWMTK